VTDEDLAIGFTQTPLNVYDPPGNKVQITQQLAMPLIDTS